MGSRIQKGKSLAFLSTVYNGYFFEAWCGEFLLNPYSLLGGDLTPHEFSRWQSLLTIISIKNDKHVSAYLCNPGLGIWSRHCPSDTLSQSSHQMVNSRYQFPGESILTAGGSSSGSAISFGHVCDYENSDINVPEQRLRLLRPCMTTMNVSLDFTLLTFYSANLPTILYTS